MFVPVPAAPQPPFPLRGGFKQSSPLIFLEVLTT
jgi:hypothetical protein